MTEEIMPKEDRMGKILSFIGGCIAGVVGVFAVAVMSEMSPNSASSSDSSETDTDIDEQEELLSPQEDGGSASGN
jgi:hypothetical protein